MISASRFLRLMAAQVAVAAVVAGCSSQASDESAVLVGAGDIAGCESRSDDATATLLDTLGGTVFTLGDNAYPDGSAAQFAECYAPTWGRHLDRTRPAVGNHDYGTRNAQGYFDYFGERAGTPGEGWYSYDAGGWHVVVLNSECDQLDGGCEDASPQLQWLATDLEEHRTQCLLAYWHSPRFSSGEHGDHQRLQPLWEALADAGAEIVLSADDHHYERFEPLGTDGTPVEDGVRQFVVGTGGAALREVEVEREHSEFISDDVHGVLRLALRADGYGWRFIGEPDGTVIDQGEGSCR